MVCLSSMQDWLRYLEEQPISPKWLWDTLRHKSQWIRRWTGFSPAVESWAEVISNPFATQLVSLKHSFNQEMRHFWKLSTLKCNSDFSCRFMNEILYVFGNESYLLLLICRCWFIVKSDSYKRQLFTKQKTTRPVSEIVVTISCLYIQAHSRPLI